MANSMENSTVQNQDSPWSRYFRYCGDKKSLGSTVYSVREIASHRNPLDFAFKTFSVSLSLSTAILGLLYGLDTDNSKLLRWTVGIGVASIFFDYIPLLSQVACGNNSIRSQLNELHQQTDENDECFGPKRFLSTLGWYPYLAFVFGAAAFGLGFAALKDENTDFISVLGKILITVSPVLSTAFNEVGAQYASRQSQAILSKRLDSYLEKDAELMGSIEATLKREKFFSTATSDSITEILEEITDEDFKEARKMLLNEVTNNLLDYMQLKKTAFEKQGITSEARRIESKIETVKRLQETANSDIKLMPSKKQIKALCKYNAKLRGAFILETSDAPILLQTFSQHSLTSIIEKNRTLHEDSEQGIKNIPAMGEGFRAELSSSSKNLHSHYSASDISRILENQEFLEISTLNSDGSIKNFKTNESQRNKIILELYGIYTKGKRNNKTNEEIINQIKAIKTNYGYQASKGIGIFTLSDPSTADGSDVESSASTDAYYDNYSSSSASLLSSAEFTTEPYSSKSSAIESATGSYSSGIPTASYSASSS